MAAKITEVDTDTFDAQVLRSDVPVLVDFFATWCGPCKMMAPLLEQIAHDLDGELKVVKLDVDENGEVAQKYSVTAMPTLVLFQDGEPIARHVGLLKEQQLLDFLLSVI